MNCISPGAVNRAVAVNKRRGESIRVRDEETATDTPVQGATRRFWFIQSFEFPKQRGGRLGIVEFRVKLYQAPMVDFS